MAVVHNAQTCFTPVKSLAGVVGRIVAVDSHVYAPAAAGLFTALVERPERLWAIIQNTAPINGGDDNMQYLLGATGTETGYIRPWGTLLLNEDLPWWGTVRVDPGTGVTCQICVTEAYLEG